MMINKRIKVGFMGTPDFACPTLEKLYNDSDIELCFVVTKEDKQYGRGKEMKESDVKRCIKKLCERQNAWCAIQTKRVPDIFTPHKIKEDRDVIDAMKKCEVDFIVVVAYGQILSKEILDIPKVACINGHASILPKYRGSSPIQASILSGDKETGTTAMLMSEGLDEGDILNVKKINIKDDDTGESLFEKLSHLTADVVIETIKNYESITPIKQDDEKATYVKMIKKEDGLVDFEKETFSMIDRKVRAYYPWPGAYIIENEKRIKIFKVQATNANDCIDKNNECEKIKNIKIENENIKIKNENIKIENEKIEKEKLNNVKIENEKIKNTKINNSKLIYKVKDGYIEILELQQEGKKRMSAKDYLNGMR